jgi:hypothetical protein
VLIIKIMKKEIMKKLIVVLVITTLVNVTITKGQVTSDTLAVEVKTVSYRSNHVAIGYHVNNFAHDFGYGIGITSPYFVLNTLAVRASCNFQWFNYIDKITTTYSMASYQNIKVGILSSAYILDKGARLYGEMGAVILVCPSTITSTNVSAGGYGLFGFEFFIHKGFSYFIELGAIGTKTTADNVTTIPIFSNGFTTSGGLRLYLKGKH